MNQHNPAIPPREYEFDEAQNAVFSGVAGAMRFVGIVQVVVGVLQLGSAAVQLMGGNVAGAAGAVIQGIVLFLIGIWTTSAAKHVGLIVTTQGSDITHLMSAMGELGKLYRLQRIVFIVMIAFVVLFILVGAAVGMGAPSNG